MSSLINKQFAMYDIKNFPSVEISRNGRVYRNRKLLISPYTTGEPILVLQTTIFADPESKAKTASEIDKYAHIHDYAEEIMIFEREVNVVIDGIMYNVPEGGVLVAKAGCRHSCQVVDNTKDTTLTCIFVPTIPADEDPDYVHLIQRTKEYLAGSDVIRI